MNELLKLLNSPILKIDVFAFIFNGSHVVHEPIGIEPTFKNLISEEDLFALLGHFAVLHESMLCKFEIKSEK